MFSTRSPNQPLCGGRAHTIGEVEEDMLIHTAQGAHAHTLPNARLESNRKDARKCG